jgi:hypothetical protein
MKTKGIEILVTTFTPNAKGQPTGANLDASDATNGIAQYVLDAMWPNWNAVFVKNSGKVVLNGEADLKDVLAALKTAKKEWPVIRDIESGAEVSLVIRVSDEDPAILMYIGI